MKRNWFHQVFIGVDQLVNAILAGWADETISARCFRLGRKDEVAGTWGRWRIAWVIVDWLFIVQDVAMAIRYGAWPMAKHCERAYINECDRSQLPPEYRRSSDEP